MPLAQALIRHERCGVLLLCYSVPENWRKTLIRSFRESCPSGRIVGIIGGDLKRASESFDAVISSTDKADALLEAILGGERRRQSVG
jgi:thiamine monophosphate kinase